MRFKTIFANMRSMQIYVNSIFANIYSQKSNEICEFMWIHSPNCIKSHIFAYMQIYANLCHLCDLFKSNICESDLFDKFAFSHIRINSHLCDYANTFDTNMRFHIRINSHIFAMQIYANLCDLSNACKFIWSFDHAYLIQPSFVCLFDCFFTSDHHTFCGLLKVRWDVIGCINHDIVMVLCSELLMRWSFYIHPEYGKKFLVSYGDRIRSFQTWAVNCTRVLYRRQYYRKS